MMIKKNNKSEITDYQLYCELKKLYLNEAMGFVYSSKKLKTLRHTYENRNNTIFEKAWEDAMVTFTQKINIGFGLKVIEINRMELMNNFEVAEFMQKSGAARGNPVLDETTERFVQISAIFGIQPENLLICKVAGLSMIEASIDDGDTLLADKTSQARNGDIIIVSVNGELFVKRLKVEEERRWLISENRNYPPAEIKNEMNVKIFGVVKKILKDV